MTAATVRCVRHGSSRVLVQLVLVQLLLITVVPAPHGALSSIHIEAFSAQPPPPPPPPPSRTRRSRNGPTNGDEPTEGRKTGRSGPKGATSTRRTSRRSPRPERNTDQTPRRSGRSVGPSPVEELFDPKAVTRSQSANEAAVPLSLFCSEGDGDGSDDGPSPPLRLRSSDVGQVVAQVKLTNDQDDNDTSNDTGNHNASHTNGECDVIPPPIRGKPIPPNAHFEQLSLDSLFPHLPHLNLSKTFFTDSAFREAIRQSARRDIFYSTPAYANLSPKVADMMLDDDSSLQGSWNCHGRRRIPSTTNDRGQGGGSEPSTVRMEELTVVLQDRLGDGAPTGDEFIMALGRLCGFNPSTHWIDIIGIKDRRVAHSWHQDTGRSVTTLSTDDVNVNTDVNANANEPGNFCYTVMLGFPCEDQYDCTGVFSHVLKLAEEHSAPEGHNVNEPLLFEGVVREESIVRPKFGLGKEILRYR